MSLPSGERAGQLDRLVGDVLAAGRARPAAFAGNAVPARRLFALARERGVADDHHVRDGLVRYRSLTQVSRFSQLRARAAAASGRPPGAESSITKLAISHICRTSRDVSFEILGADTMLAGEDAPYDGTLQTVGLASFGVSVGGGTDEVQRNLVAERVLGLPREPQLDRDVPYRELLTSRACASVGSEVGRPHGAGLHGPD